MSLEVTLNIFSGRENPRWTLSDDQESELIDRIATITKPTFSKTPGSAGLLGYRGFTVSRSSDHPRGAYKLLINEGILDFGRAEESLESGNRELSSGCLRPCP